MSHPKQAQSTEIQIRKVYKNIHQHGSINRYEADMIGVCHLAARIKELKDRGLIIRHFDQNGVPDFHDILHDGIRRYCIDWENMAPDVVEYFAGWSHD
jgi:hypothetical protein